MVNDHKRKSDCGANDYIPRWPDTIRYNPPHAKRWLTNVEPFILSIRFGDLFSEHSPKQPHHLLRTHLECSIPAPYRLSSSLHSQVGSSGTYSLLHPTSSSHCPEANRRRTRKTKGKQIKRKSNRTCPSLRSSHYPLIHGASANRPTATLIPTFSTLAMRAA